MNPSYIGAVWYFAGNFAPYGFAFCNGALQSISENAALFNLLGTTYGGDGVNTFGLPDLRGRATMSWGQGPGLNNYNIGQFGGTETVTLTVNNLAQHSHLVSAGTSATAQAPTANVSYINQVTENGGATNFFSTAASNANLIGSTIANSGSSLPINILQPLLTVNPVIALYGIYPSQN